MLTCFVPGQRPGHAHVCGHNPAISNAYPAISTTCAGYARAPGTTPRETLGYRTRHVAPPPCPIKSPASFARAAPRQAEPHRVCPSHAPEVCGSTGCWHESGPIHVPMGLTWDSRPHFPLPSVLCPLPSALCLPCVFFPLSFANYPLPSALCPLSFPSAHCPLPTVLFQLPTALFPLPTTLYPRDTVLCPLPSALYPPPSAFCPLSFVLYPLSSVYPVSSAHCPMPTAHCPLPTALCPLPSAPCPLPSALCPPSSALCPGLLRRPVVCRDDCQMLACVWLRRHCAAWTMRLSLMTLCCLDHDIVLLGPCD